MTTRKCYGLAALIMLLAGCTAPRISSSWKAPVAVKNPVYKIMVAGLMRPADSSLCGQTEAQLVNDLRARGFAAFSAMSTFGATALENLNEGQLQQRLVQSGYDVVITIALLQKEKEKSNHAPQAIPPAFMVSNNRFWEYYATTSQRINAPGYYAANTLCFWESNLYHLTTRKLLYSVQTQSFHFPFAVNRAPATGHMIVKSMLKQNVLEKGAPVFATSL